MFVQMTRIFDGRWTSQSSKVKEALPWIPFLLALSHISCVVRFLPTADNFITLFFANRHPHSTHLNVWLACVSRYRKYTFTKFASQFAHVFLSSSSFFCRQLMTHDASNLLSMCASIRIHWYDETSFLVYCVISKRTGSQFHTDSKCGAATLSGTSTLVWSQNIHFQIVFDELSCAHFFPFHSLAIFSFLRTEK